MTVKVMHLRFLLLMTLLFIGPLPESYSQHWTQGIKATGSSQSEGLYDDADMVVDGQGNIVIAGYFRKDSLSFGEFTVNTDDDIYEDIFICRIGSDRTVQWLKRIEAGQNYGQDVGLAIDDDKNIYLTGSLDSRIFVSKYDSTGTLIWNTDFGGNVQGYGTAVKTDLYDNVYVTGGGGWTFFMAKINSSGEVAWVKDIWHNSSNACYVRDVTVDALGNIYFAGTFQLDLALEQITLHYTNSFGPSVFWGKMDTNGNFIWAKSATGRASDLVKLELTSDGNLFLAGGVAGTAGMSFGGYYVPRGNCCEGPTSFLAKTDLQGNVLWAKAGTSNYYGSVPVDMQVDYAGNLYLTGLYFTCYGTYCSELDFYVEKYDSQGSPLWRTEYASGDTEASKAIDVDNNGFLYLLGVNSSPTFIDQDNWTLTRTYGVGIFDTESSTYKKTARPMAERLIFVCDVDIEPDPLQLTAEGEQIRWYRDATLSEMIGEGNEFSPETIQTDTFYVTQTVAGIESWPKPVIVRVSPIPDGNITLERDTLFAPETEGIRYQWLYKGDSIENATQRFVGVDTVTIYSNFSVLLSVGPCQKLLSSITTAVGEENELQSIQCYPNPTTSSIFIRSSGQRISSVRVKNCIGNDFGAARLSASDEYIIDLTDQEAGLYFIEIIQSNIHRFVKVVKR